MRRVLVAFGLLWTAVPLAAQQLEAGVTLQGARGRYIFEDATTSWMLLASFTAEGDRWRFGVTLPGVYQNSSAVSYVGGVPIGTGGPNGGTVARRGSGERIPGRRHVGGALGLQDITAGDMSRSALMALTTDSGFVEAPGAYRFTLGDPILSVGRDVWTSFDGAHRVGLQGFAKLPLAPVSSGVGTGAADVGVAISTAITLGGTLVALDVNHWIVGDLPDLALRDISGAMVGVGRVFGWMRQHSVMLAYSAATAAVARSEAPQTVSLAYGFLSDAGGGLNAGIAHGLTESSAEWTAWVGWRRALGR